MRGLEPRVSSWVRRGWWSPPSPRSRCWSPAPAARMGRGARRGNRPAHAAALAGRPGEDRPRPGWPRRSARAISWSPSTGAHAPRGGAGAPVTATAVPEPDAMLTEVDQQSLPDYPVANPSLSLDDGRLRGDQPVHVLAGQRPGLGRGDLHASRARGRHPLVRLREWHGQRRGRAAAHVRDPGDDQLPQHDTGCHGLYPADSSSSSSHRPIHWTRRRDPWGPGCDPDGGDPGSPRCAITVNNLRTFAMLAFEGRRCPGSRSTSSLTCTSHVSVRAR